MSTSDLDLAALVAEGLGALGLGSSLGGTTTSAVSPSPFSIGAPRAGLPTGALPAPPRGVPGLPTGAGVSPSLGNTTAPPSRTPTVGDPHIQGAAVGPSIPVLGAPGVARAPRVGLIPEFAAHESALPYFAADAAPGAPPDFGGPVQATSSGFAIPLRPAPVFGAPSPSSLDVASVRAEFPILATRVNGKPLVWLDNAATTQKPRAVIDRVSRFYETENSNIHRAAHALAARATDAYEGARESVRRFLGASSTDEIVFVRGTTEGINFIAKSWGAKHVGAGDEIVLTHLEHHSNIVPWQMLADTVGAKLRVVPVDDDGQIRLEEAERIIGPRTKLVSATHVSNALGTVVPVKELARLAHRYGARIVVDGAQSVSHMPIDVKELEADFFVFSGHKVFGPTGIGAVFGRPDAWAETPPWQGGGNMIVDVTFAATRYAGIPARFEAGTGNIADAVGLGAALDYLLRLGMDRVAAHEQALLAYGTARLREIPGLHLVGTAHDKAGVLSFVLDGYRPEDIGKHLDHDGIAVRSGHHCAQPALRRFGHEATVRPSLALYNTRADLDCLVASLRKLPRR
jgi:cysteine desulfurase/selenocysteine lyase